MLVTTFESSVDQSTTVVYIKPASRTLAVGEKLTGAKVLGIQKGTERGIGDLVVGC